MRAYVFPDRALERDAGRYVWLSIDSEKERNAEFLAKYPITAYPTLLILDSASRKIAIRWLGALTVGQLKDFLDDGERAIRGDLKGADAALARADKRMGARKNRSAAADFKKALAKAPPGWPSTDRAVESLLTLLSMTGKNEECVATAQERLPSERSAHFASVAAAGLGCALELAPPARDEALAIFEPAARSAVGEPPIAIAADDLSSIYGMLVGARAVVGDKEGARATAGDWLRYLDAAAEAASTPEERAVFDPHRLSAAIEAGIPEHAIPPLLQSEKDFPDDYNPPARLALAYKDAGDLDQALAAANRALALAYGPRKVRVYQTKSDILAARGDKTGAIATLEEALNYAKQLPAAQGSKRLTEALQGRIAKAKQVPA